MSTNPPGQTSQVLRVAGYNDDIYQFTLPVPRNPKAYYALQYNGKYWTEAGHSTLMQETFDPFDDRQLTQGQIYFQWDSAASRFEVVRRNGTGGLIVDNAMLQVPSQFNNQELWMVRSSITGTGLYYFYVRRPASGEYPIVTATSSDGGLVQLTVSSLNGADPGDQIWLNCFNIGGTIEANGQWTGTVIDATHVDLNGSSFQKAFDPSSVSPECATAQIAASSTGHITSDFGVEVLNSIPNGDIHWTLVGMCWVDANGMVEDTPTHRNCASWYNSGGRNCLDRISPRISGSSAG